MRTNEIRENLDAVSVETNLFMNIHAQFVRRTKEIRELVPITRLDEDKIQDKIRPWQDFSR